MKLIHIANEPGFFVALAGSKQRLTKQIILVSEQNVRLYPVPDQLHFRERRTCQGGSQIGS